jgi:coenzyme F420-dependent glucose-6-phosphate dehydrogenase
MGDHFLPWFHDDAQAPAVWPWLGTALASTSSIRIGSGVTVPIGGRYHPLLVAQQAATLDNMFPGRFLLGVGTGQAMSEERFLGRWPDWKQRGDRLREALELMRKFWTAEDYFDWDGKYFPAKKLYLYTRPAGRVEIYVSARGKKAAEIAGQLGDHVMTTVSDAKIVREVLETFEKTMLNTGRNPKNAFRIGYIEYGLGNMKDMLRLMKHGAAAMGLLDAARGEMDPRRIQSMGAQAPDEAIKMHHHLVEHPEDLIQPSQELIDAGCNYLVYSDVSRNPNENMKKLLRDVIPKLKENREGNTN